MITIDHNSIPIHEHSHKTLQLQPLETIQLLCEVKNVIYDNFYL